MTTQWYSQQGQATGATNHSQSHQMHHNGFHHSGAADPGAAVNGAQHHQGFHRSAPQIVRPPSAASTSSASSYTTAHGSTSGKGLNHDIDQNQNQGIPPTMNAPPGVGVGGVHHRHSLQGGLHPTNGRYPMPQHNNGAATHLIRPIPRGPMHARQLHQIPPSVRNMPNSVGHHDPSHNRHPQFGANRFHPQDYHGRYMPMNQSTPYHNGGPRNGSYPYPASLHHTAMQRQQQQHLFSHKLAQFQRNLDSPETTAIDHQALSRSPSPPPPPPQSNERKLTQSESPPTVGRVVSSESSVGANPLQERKNLQEEYRPQSSKKMNTQEDPTADAASILLQLGAMMKKDGTATSVTKEKDSHSNEGNTAENRKPQQSKFLSHSPFPRPSSNISLGLTASHSSDRSEITQFSAPDLTSKPSTESTEVESEFPAPIPENYPKRLALPYDDSKLNSLHCFLRSELLEVFAVEKSNNKSPTHSPGSSVGRVGLRCVHCALVHRQKDARDEAPMAVFYPKSIAEIYRLVTSWQRCHLRKCRNLPPAVRSKWQSLRDSDKSRGKTQYWITSAKEIGLIDCRSRAGGIRFGPHTITSGKTKTETSTPSEVPPSETKSEEVV